MKRAAMVAVAGLLTLGMVPVQAGAANAAPSKPGSPTVYVGDLTAGQLARLSRSGIDREDLSTRRVSGGKVRVEVVLTSGEAAGLRKAGIGLSEKKVDGQTASRLMAAQNASGYTVFRSYSEPGGIRDEMVATAAANPRLVKLEVIGQTVQGQDIVALKVTRDALTERDGSRPAVLYSAAQTPGSGSRRR